MTILGLRAINESAEANNHYPTLVAVGHHQLERALGFSGRRQAVDSDALAAAGFTDPLVARQVLNILQIAVHQDAGDTPNLKLEEHYRIVAGLLAKNILTVGTATANARSAISSADDIAEAD